jgi:phage shock protein A
MADDGSVVCPECSLPLVGKAACLTPCGHVVHTSCAEFITGMTKALGARCPHCAETVVSSRTIHASDAVAPSTSSDIERRLQDVKVAQAALLQSHLEQRKAAKRSSALKHQCATLHQDNARLESRVKIAFGSAVPTTAPVASSNGIVGSSFTTAPTIADSFARDPLTSTAKLQYYIQQTMAAEASLKSQLEDTERNIRTVGGQLSSLRESRRALHEKAKRQRQAERRAAIAERASRRALNAASADVKRPRGDADHDHVGDAHPRPPQPSAESGRARSPSLPLPLQELRQQASSGSLRPLSSSPKRDVRRSPRTRPSTAKSRRSVVTVRFDEVACNDDSDVEVISLNDDNDAPSQLSPLALGPIGVNAASRRFVNVGARYGEIPRPRRTQRSLAVPGVKREVFDPAITGNRL